MNILVTGGAGFIGSHVVDRYVDLGHKVIVIDDLSSGKKENLNSKAKFYQENIRSQAVLAIITKERIDIINHHAAQIEVRKSVTDPVFDASVNIEGSLNLLEAAQKNGIKKFIFASSGGAIYGDACSLPTAEDYHPLRPISPYGVAKLAVEYYLWYYYQVYGLSFVSLRYANVYGPRQDPFGEAGVVAIFSQKMLAGKEPIINGNGEQVRDFIYVEDVVSANTAALEKNFVGEVNIGTGSSTSINKLFSLLVEIVGKEIAEKHGPEKKGDQRKSVLAIKKAKKVLGWVPKIALREGLEETVGYFRTQLETDR